MKLIKLTAISAAVLASTAALAAEPVAVVQPANSYSDRTFFQTVTHPAAISAEVGTLGYGANIGWSLNDKVELQAGWAGGDVSNIKDNFDVNDIEYDITDSDFSNPYLGVQIRPAANWFTMGAGIIVPHNDIDVEARASGNFFEINDISYNAAETGTLSGSIDHRNKLAPYATIGFRPNIGNNWGVFGELGAAYMGKTDATVRAVGDVDSIVNYTAENGTVKGTATRAEVAAEAQKELEDKNWLEWMPIVKVGATYRF